MSDIEFTSEEKEILVHKIQRYFQKFDAEFLLDFFSKEIGAYHYNRGLQDVLHKLFMRWKNQQNL